MQGVANMIDSTCNYISTASNLPLEILSSHLPHETSSHFQPSGLPGARQLLFSRRFLATHTIPPPQNTARWSRWRPSPSAYVRTPWDRSMLEPAFMGSCPETGGTDGSNHQQCTSAGTPSVSLLLCRHRYPTVHEPR